MEGQRRSTKLRFVTMVGSQKAEKRPRHWIFCSSGARQLYLENVVRALALPRGEKIKYRYESNLVSETFRKLVGNPAPFVSVPIVGDIAYLCYLDNRDRLLRPKIFPVREAIICSVSLLGTTYVVEMELQCFISWLVDPNLDETIRSLAIDPLPNWSPPGETGQEKIKAIGCWLAASQPLPNKVFNPYSAEKRSHLEAFESAVRAISRGVDFSGGDYIFANITGLYDVKAGCLVEDGKMQAGRSYELHLYHFQPGDDTHTPLNNFRLATTTDSEDVVIVGGAERYIEARYDEVIFSFRVKDEARGGAVRLGLDIKRIDKDIDNPVYILRSSILCNTNSDIKRKLFYGALIGIGIFGTQAITLFATGKLTTLIVCISLTFSLIAGMGAAFQFKTKI